MFLARDDELSREEPRARFETGEIDSRGHVLPPFVSPVPLLQVLARSPAIVHEHAHELSIHRVYGEPHVSGLSERVSNGGGGIRRVGVNRIEGRS
jgi:hypothetical protein